MDMVNDKINNYNINNSKIKTTRNYVIDLLIIYLLI